jgi:AP-2 complex subunit beta-1
LIEACLLYVPQESVDAELLADRLVPRLQHTNSAIVLASARIIFYLTNYIANDAVVDRLMQKLTAPLGKF